MRYMRVVRIPWRVLLPGAAVAFLAALAGASLVSAVSPAIYRPLVPIMLTAVLIYVLWHKDLGERHAPIAFSRARSYIALAAIGGIGFYDGFFGPGTGSFLMLLFIRLYGFDFLHASAGARAIKLPNSGTPTYAMRRFLEKAGLEVRRIEAELPVLRKVIDLGLPLILEEEYSSSRHVAVAIGYPGVVWHGRPLIEPHHLGKGWVGFDYAAAFGTPVEPEVWMT